MTTCFTSQAGLILLGFVLLLLATRRSAERPVQVSGTIDDASKDKVVTVLHHKTDHPANGVPETRHWVDTAPVD